MTDQAYGNILWDCFGYCGRIREQFMVQGSSKATAVLCSIQHLLRMNSNLVGIQSEQKEIV